MHPNPAYPSAAQLSAERVASAVADHAIATNAEVARILTGAIAEMWQLDLTVESMAPGYDLSDVLAMLGDMMPRMDAETQRRVLQDAYDAARGEGI
jgi:hypothetical protein